MKNRRNAIYEAPRLTQISFEANDILLVSGEEEPRGELSEAYTGVKSILNFGDIWFE